MQQNPNQSRRLRFVLSLFCLGASLDMYSLPAAANRDDPISEFPGFSSGMQEELGGKVGITNVVNLFFEIAYGDNRINDALLGGQRQASGKMEDAQKQAFIKTLMGTPSFVEGTRSAGNLQLTDTQYNVLIEDLYEAMERARVPYHTQNRTIAILEPYQASMISAFLSSQPSVERAGKVHVGPAEMDPATP